MNVVKGAGAAKRATPFMATDLDGNLIRVFYDFRGDT
jgi:hypothetical protein